MLWEIEQGRLAFWHKAEACFRDNNCKPDTVGSFFEVSRLVVKMKDMKIKEISLDVANVNLLRSPFVTEFNRRNSNIPSATRSILIYLNSKVVGNDLSVDHVL